MPLLLTLLIIAGLVGLILAAARVGWPRLHPGWLGGALFAVVQLIGVLGK